MEPPVDLIVDQHRKIRWSYNSMSLSEKPDRAFQASKCGGLSQHGVDANKLWTGLEEFWGYGSSAFEYTQVW